MKNKLYYILIIASLSASTAAQEIQSQEVSLNQQLKLCEDLKNLTEATVPQTGLEKLYKKYGLESSNSSLANDVLYYNAYSHATRLNRADFNSYKRKIEDETFKFTPSLKSSNLVGIKSTNLFGASKTSVAVVLLV